MKFLDNNGVEVLPWPGNSSNPNAIETLWAVFKRRLAEHNLPTEEELLSKIVSLWHEDLSLQETCQKFILSMPSRLKAVVDAKGGHTTF